MDAINLKKIISKRFSDGITDVMPNIFKIVSTYKNRNFATHYFDCTNNFLEKDFDLLEYQRNLLSEDYYKSKGPLQWNFYLYFVTDRKDISNDRKIQIESDKAFTRKLITTEEELIKLIEIQSKLKDSPKAKLDIALLSVWKNRLKEINLAGIYLTKDYPKINDVFQLFLENHEFREISEQDRIVSPEEVKVDTLSSLEVEGFRCFKKENFKFKKVNLISGSNGSGKTSLLEGIELCLCGQTIENTSKKEEAKKLQIIYSNGSSDKYTPDDNKKYQARDRAWYGNNTLRGNTLSQGYHIYNFFDSDAAFRFTHESNSGEIIKQIFSRVVLGEETNLIFDRIERFNDKLSTELKSLKKQISDKIDDKKLYESKLKEFSASSTVISSLGEIISSLDQLKWNGTNLLLSDGVNRIEFQNSLNKVTFFFKLATEITWIDLISNKAIRLDLNKINHLISLYNELNNSFNTVYSKINETINSKSILEERLKVFVQSERYFLEDDVTELIGIKNRIKLLDNDIKTLNKLLKLFSQLSDIKFDIFKITYESLSNLSVSNNLELNRLMTELDILNKSIGELNRIKTDLKRIGLEYIKISNESSYCPLCKTPFPNGDIIEVIESSGSYIQGSDMINSFSEKISELEKSQIIINDRLNIMNEIKEVFTNEVTEIMDDFDSNKISNIQMKLTKIKDVKEEQLKKLLKINQKFVDINLTETELGELNIQLKNSGHDLLIGSTNKIEFITQKENLHNNIDILIKKEEELRNERTINESNLITQLSEYFKEISIKSEDLDEFLEKLKSRQDKMELIEKSYIDITHLFPLDENDNLKTFKFKFDEIEVAFTKYLEIETKNKLRNEFIEKQRLIKSTLDNLEEINKKYDDIKIVLDDIIINNNRENYLKEFFIENKQSILDIFKVIHLPNEFDDIYFESSDSIKLKVKNSNNTRELSEISTGQKSALILSLYLSLNNNLQTGPPLMIFDDPIAYVDDINTLSFLDFLRDRAIATDKQIFFATANNKLANLFQQKFDFLQDEFQIIKLSHSGHPLT